MLADQPELERAIRRIAETRAYRVQASRDEHAGRKLFLGYQAASGTPDRIEVDVNYLHRVPLVSPIERTCWQPGQYPAPQARLVGMEELAAGDRKSTRLNSSHSQISYAVFCLKKKKKENK